MKKLQLRYIYIKNIPMKDKVVCGLTDRWRWTVVYKRKRLRDNIRVLLRCPLLLSARKYTDAFSKTSNP